MGKGKREKIWVRTMVDEKAFKLETYATPCRIHDEDFYIIKLKGNETERTYYRITDPYTGMKIGRDGRSAVSVRKKTEKLLQQVMDHRKMSLRDILLEKREEFGAVHDLPEVL